MKRMRRAASCASASGARISSRSLSAPRTGIVCAEPSGSSSLRLSAMKSRLATTAASGLLISCATPAASVPMDAMRSLTINCDCIFWRSESSRTTPSVPTNAPSSSKSAVPEMLTGMSVPSRCRYTFSMGTFEPSLSQAEVFARPHLRHRVP